MGILSLETPQADQNTCSYQCKGSALLVSQQTGPTMGYALKGVI